MIVSLMKRLPSKYKRFTQIPENMRAKIEAELSRDKERFNSKRMELIKSYGIWAGGFLLVGIIMMSIGGICFLIGFASIIALIVTITKFFNALKDAKNFGV